MEGRKRIGRLRLALRACLVGVFAVAIGVFGRWVTGNQGPVVPGVVHRSAQLDGASLDRTIRRNGIRTVLNLRGGNPSEIWYQDERRAALGNDATLIDFAMASDMYLSRSQARTLVEILDHCRKPVLIHCQWGAERTGLAAAFVQLLSAEGSLERAKAQFSLYYLFLPVRDGLVMRRHVDLYEQWLSHHGLRHSPQEFRRWVRNEYRPRSPSREQWPYDPYPLIVVHRPAQRLPLAIAEKPATATRNASDRPK